MNPKEPRDKGIFRPVSAREAFYYLFAIFVIAVGLIYWWIFLPEVSDKPPGDPVVDSITHALGWGRIVPLSDTQLLLYDLDAPKTGLWRIYDETTHTLTNDTVFARAIENDPSARFSQSNWLAISSCGSNIVLAVEIGGTNSPAMIYEWATNSDKLQIFNWNDFKGNLRGLGRMIPPHVQAKDNGWFYFIGAVRSGFPISVTGSDISPRSVTCSYPSNLPEGHLQPFRGGIYTSAFNTNTHLIDVYAFSSTNLSLLYSNTLIKPPVAFQSCGAAPDFSGKRVLWIFYREPAAALIKIYETLPGFLRPSQPPLPKLYYYWSDPHVTKFHFINSRSDEGLPNPFCWGTNGDSIWLPDDKYGVKRYDLK